MRDEWPVVYYESDLANMRQSYLASAELEYPVAGYYDR